MILGSLKDLHSQAMDPSGEDLSLEQVKENNVNTLNDLNHQLQWETGRIPLVLQSAKNSINGLKYITAHATQEFGTPQIY
jgi:hypothetical protein